jgi:hypothetical protein
MSTAVKKQKPKILNRRVVVNVQDSKYKFFIDLLQNFDCVEIDEPKPVEDEYLSENDFWYEADKKIKKTCKNTIQKS